MKTVSAKLPLKYIDALDRWRQEQSDPQLTRGDALEHFVAIGLGLEPPSFEGRARPVSQAEMDERGEQYCQLLEELGSYAAVAREVGYSVSTVTRVITRYQRRSGS
jgi:hypothetical protein